MRTMGNRVDSYFRKGFHSATQTELKYNEQTNMNIIYCDKGVFLSSSMLNSNDEQFE